MRVTLYHNPQCSKSREALALFREAGVKLAVVEYLRDPLSERELLSLLGMLEGPPSALVRTKEEKYEELQFDTSTPEAVAENLAKYPELMERPVVVRGNEAAIGRPMENFKKFF